MLNVYWDTGFYILECHHQKLFRVVRYQHRPLRRKVLGDGCEISVRYIKRGALIIHLAIGSQILVQSVNNFYTWYWVFIYVPLGFCAFCR